VTDPPWVEREAKERISADDVRVMCNGHKYIYIYIYIYHCFLQATTSWLDSSGKLEAAIRRRVETPRHGSKMTRLRRRKRRVASTSDPVPPGSPNQRGGDLCMPSAVCPCRRTGGGGLRDDPGGSEDPSGGLLWSPSARTLVPPPPLSCYASIAHTSGLQNAYIPTYLRLRVLE